MLEHGGTGDRWQARARRQVGKTVVIGVGDDHSRLAYRDLHGSEKAINASSILTCPVALLPTRAAGPSRPSCQSTAATAGNQVLQADQQLFIQYAAAREAGHHRLVRYIYNQLMSPELRAGVRWWLGNVRARTPFDPAYRIPAHDRAAALSRRSARLVELGQSKQEFADRHHVVDVVVAGALFLLGLAGVLRPGPIRPTAVVLGTGVLIAATVLLVLACPGVGVAALVRRHGVGRS